MLILQYRGTFLNQVLAWFLKIDPVKTVGMRSCVCVPAPKAIKN